MRSVTVDDNFAILLRGLPYMFEGFCDIVPSGWMESCVVLVTSQLAVGLQEQVQRRTRYWLREFKSLAWFDEISVYAYAVPAWAVVWDAVIPGVEDLLMNMVDRSARISDVAKFLEYGLEVFAIVEGDKAFNILE